MKNERVEQISMGSIWKWVKIFNINMYILHQNQGINKQTNKLTIKPSKHHMSRECQDQVQHSQQQIFKYILFYLCTILLILKWKMLATFSYCFCYVFCN